MAKFNVGIQGVEEGNRGVNFNLLVDAGNIADALDKAKVELGKVLEGAGLATKTPASETTSPAT